MGIGNWLVKKFGNFLTKNDPPKRAYLCDFDRICHEVKLADILLVEGRNRISRTIQRVTVSPWSHASLYIGRLHDIEDPLLREMIHRHYQGKPNEQLILESIVGLGTFITSIKKYENDHVRICRPMGLAHQDAQRVISFAVKRIGMKYNIRHIFDIARFLIGGRLIPRRFKSSLFKHEPNRVTQDICSAMIARAFNSINFPVLPLVRKNNKENIELIHRNPNLYTPSDFDYSPYFAIIKYPIFALGEPSYRNLPWQEGLISNDEVGIIKHEENHLNNTPNNNCNYTPPG